MSEAVPEAVSQAVTHAPGTFCYWELGTTDRTAAKAFYTALFGWTIEEDVMPEGGVYGMISLDGKHLGGLYEITEEMQAQGVPPNWLPYVAVENADEAVAEAKRLGGAVVMEPMDVMEHGRMAYLRDPRGAHFAVWQAKSYPGTGTRGEPGSPCWNELATDDREAAEAFYTNLLPWSTQVQTVTDYGPYVMFMIGEEAKGGLMEMTEEWAGIPPHWMTYFTVENCDASAAKAEELGATLKVPPSDIPNVGRFALIQDPQGSHFSILQPSEDM